MDRRRDHLRRGHYLRQDLPDGHAQLLSNIAGELLEGAGHLRSGSQSRHPEDHHIARIDAERLMLRISDRLTRLAKDEKVPG